MAKIFIRILAIFYIRKNSAYAAFSGVGTISL
jgi:hypothetical protein